MKYTLSTFLLLGKLTFQSAAQSQEVTNLKDHDWRGNEVLSLIRRLDDYEDLFEGGHWKQLGVTIYGTDRFDASGSAVAISNNGDIIVT